MFECRGKIHQMIALEKLDEQQSDQWLQLCGDWPTFGGGQKAHFHPQITPDRNWILFTGGDPATETNHIFLLDASDLSEVAEIRPELLSASGENDRTRAKLPKDLRANALTVKAVTASGFKPGFGPENAIDQNLVTLWGADGDGQWIQFDLGTVQLVQRVFIDWFAGENARNVLRSLLRTMVGIGKPSSMVPVAVVLQAPSCGNVRPFATLRPDYRPW